MNHLKNSLNDRYTGKRYICLVRQSDDSQGTTSTEAQLEWLKAEGKHLGMVHVDDIILNGLTGSLPGKRKDLEGLLLRKKNHNDFEVLLVQRMDRLTRSGSRHGFWFEHECACAGIEVLYPGDDLPNDDRYSSLIKVAKLEAAKEQARSIGQRSVQGSMHSIQQGRNSVISRTPFACDRLYLTNDKKPLFVIRNLGDGRQQKLTLDRSTVVDTYGQVGGGAKGHYRKQKDERVVIVPGAKDKIRTVRLIFDLHYNQRWGGKKIADLLNCRRILSPTGKGWSQRQVESIYENPIYCGVALGQRISQGIYYRRGETQPEEVQLDEQILVNCQNAPKQLRSPEDWIWQNQPLMAKLLDRGLADKALGDIKKLLTERWERSQDPTRQTRSTSKHKASQYILTGLLSAKQDGGDLTGVLCGRVGKKTRYYRHRRARLGYRKGSVYNRLIRAEPLEQEILNSISEVIVDAPQIRQRIIDAIKAEAPSVQVEQELAELTKQRNALTQRVQLIVKTLDEASLKDAKPELDRLGNQRRDLDRQIKEKQHMLQYADEDPNELADRVINRLNEIADNHKDLSSVAKRELFEAFVDRVEVDMATKDAQVWLKLPLWALKNCDQPMRLAHSSASSTVDETHQRPNVSIRLAYMQCRYVHDRSRRRICYLCRRQAG